MLSLWTVNLCTNLNWFIKTSILNGYWLSSLSPVILELLECTPNVYLHHLKCIWSKSVWWYRFVFPAFTSSNLWPSQILLPHVSELYRRIDLIMPKDSISLNSALVAFPFMFTVAEPKSWITNWAQLGSIAFSPRQIEKNRIVQSKCNVATVEGVPYGMAHLWHSIWIFLRGSVHALVIKHWLAPSNRLPKGLQS